MISGETKQYLDFHGLQLYDEIVDEKIASAIFSGAGFSVKVVDWLPEYGEPRTIYFVRLSPEESATTNSYEEYMWINDTWEMIGTTEVNLSDYYTSGKTDELLSGKQNILTPGDGVSISGDTIGANTSAVTISAITIADGAPIDATGIWPNDVIPQGTTLQEILEKLLLREILPSEAEKPSISLSGGKSIGVKEIGETVTIPAITLNQNNGKFDKYRMVLANSAITPDITWSEQEITASVSKFGNVSISSGTTGTSSITATVELGANKVTYSSSAKYTKPENHPVTNLGHETDSTIVVETGGTDTSAIWTASTATASTTVTATGVYPCYTNIGSGTLTPEANTKCSLTTGTTITLIDVPAENESLNRHFVFEYPSGRTCTFKIKDPSGGFVDFAGSYTEQGTAEHSGYVRLETTGGVYWGVNTYQLILSKSLNS